MIISVYPSQDHTNQTLWIFSGSSSAARSHSIRTSSSSDYNGVDSWQFSGSDNNGDFYDANKPSDSNFQLSPLFSSASTNTIDMASVRARIPGGGRTNITFAASATNTPTITVNNGNNSRTISHLFMDDDPGGNNPDDLGIRVSPSGLGYSQGQASAWVGAGLINKPIGDFFAGTYNGSVGPLFTPESAGSMRVVVNSAFIPEPEEYALVFGLFALGFVFFRRHFQKKKRRQAAPTS